MSRKTVTLKLTEAECNMILSHLFHNDNGEHCNWYYGQKKHFEDRQRMIIFKINEATRKAMP